VFTVENKVPADSHSFVFTVHNKVVPDDSRFLYSLYIAKPFPGAMQLFRPGHCPEIPEILKFVLKRPEIGVRS